MDFKDKVKEKRIELGLTLKDLSDRVGVSAPTIQRYESGEIKNLRRDKIKALADALHVSPEYLMDWKDNSISKVPLPSFIPLLGKIRCGVPLLDESNWEEQIQVPDGMDADFAARAEGDSMLYAGICPDDVILFREGKTPQNGQVVATRHCNQTEGVNLKYYIKTNGQAILRSANPHYEDIPLNEDHEIIGVMTGLIRDGAPSISEYKSLLALKSDIEDRWTDTIAMAAAHGIQPEDIQNMIKLQATMAFNLAKKKK